MCKILWSKILNVFRPRYIIVPIEQKNTEDVSSNPWKVASAIQPEDMDYVLKIIYTNEIGIEITEYCMVVFESSSEYKLVSPELGSGKILQKSNLTDLQIKKVLKVKNS
jgi:hypothetical protein